MDEIYGFYLTEVPQVFRLNRMGEYRILLIGASLYHNRSDFKVGLTRKDSLDKIQTEKPWISATTIRRKPACIYRTFYVEKGGEFEIRFQNTQDLAVIRLSFWSLLFLRNMDPNKVWISIQYNQL